MRVQQRQMSFQNHFFRIWGTSENRLICFRITNNSPYHEHEGTERHYNSVITGQKANISVTSVCHPYCWRNGHQQLWGQFKAWHVQLKHSVLCNNITVK
jgi:hypothetical protein